MNINNSSLIESLNQSFIGTLIRKKSKFEIKKKEEVTGRNSKVKRSVQIRGGVWGGGMRMRERND